MKKLLFLAMALFVAGITITSCHKSDKGGEDDSLTADTSVVDTTIYGICGEGTTMHNLELITDAGDTLNFVVNVDEEDSTGVIVIKGGMLCGDRMAVIGKKDAEFGLVAQNIINLKSLQGRWTNNLDRNFEIMEDGKVVSHQDIESKPYTEWRICNGHLVLNRDTFNVLSLGADSLSLENNDGIYDFKRLK